MKKTARKSGAYWYLSPPVVYVDSAGNLKGVTDYVYYSPTYGRWYSMGLNSMVTDYTDTVPSLPSPIRKNNTWTSTEADVLRSLGYMVL